ncbi:MAG TPA: macro domain-containing protein [Gemmatimonadaceae bacterium]|nr:macro domain-containing protein [Gemmatimonadaceae bacterium]
MTPPHAALAVIDVRVDDLGFYEGEAIARPVNAMLEATTPVMRRLEAAGGAALQSQMRLSEPLPVGAAVVTGAGDLGVQLLIHGVVASREEPVSRASVRAALVSTLHRVDAFRIRELAIAPFGLGAGNLDIEDSADVMIEVLREHMRRSQFPASVLIVAESELEEQVLRARLGGAA